MPTPTTFTVVYRTGGTLRCVWRRCSAVETMGEANKLFQSLARQGYKALVYRTAELDAIGMPEGWEGGK